MAVYGLHRMMVPEPRFHFLFLAVRRVQRAPRSLGVIGTPAAKDAKRVQGNP